MTERSDIVHRLTSNVSVSVSLEVESLRAPFALQALITSNGVAQEGDFVRALEPAWTLLVSMLQDDPEALHKLSPRQFEELIAATYDKAGYDEVILTPRSGDFGRDVIAIKNGWGSLRIIDQAKCFKPGHLVDANDVRALLGVLQADRNATKASGRLRPAEQRGGGRSRQAIGEMEMRSPKRGGLPRRIKDNHGTCRAAGSETRRTT